MTVISYEGVRKEYRLGLFGRRRVVALDGLSLAVPEGVILGVLGPNGAGKSTAIKLLMNIIRPSVGRVALFGHEPENVEARKQVGYLPENPAPYEYLTGREFVELGAVLSGVASSDRAQRVTDVLEQVRMSRAAHLQIRRYSKGMVQRISLAQALVGRPKLLVLDEPTSGLDVLGRQLIRSIIESERARGTTVLMCSHIIPDVEVLCDRVAVIIGGKLVKEGPVNELLTGQGADVEVVIEAPPGLEGEVGSLGQVTRSGPRLTVKLDETSVPKLLQHPGVASARIISLQRTRHSLEDVFLQAMRASGQDVGGLIE